MDHVVEEMEKTITELLKTSREWIETAPDFAGISQIVQSANGLIESYIRIKGL